MTDIIAKIRKRDGEVVCVLPDGREEVMTPEATRPMTDAEIEAAAATDPDMQAMIGARPVPRVKTLRRTLRLTQEEFAARYRIPLGTLRDWEQGRAEPDQPTRAYLAVIAREPEAVARALEPLSEPA
jgi:putative transcriptional regulator